jgi:hypothetical protein
MISDINCGERQEVGSQAARVRNRGYPAAKSVFEVVVQDLRARLENEVGAPRGPMIPDKMGHKAVLGNMLYCSKGSPPHVSSAWPPAAAAHPSRFPAVRRRPKKRSQVALTAYASSASSGATYSVLAYSVSAGEVRVP